MNKLNIGLGGHPATGDDFLFLQQQLSDVLLGMAKTSGESFIALSGCEFSIIGGTTISWNAGYMYINGEVCQVDAGTAAYPANTTWQVVETYDPAGNDEYEDLNFVNTWVYRKATILGNAGGTYFHDNLKFLKDYLLFPPIAAVDFSPHLGTGWVLNTANLFAKKSQLGEVMFDGKIEVTSYNSSTTPTCLTLPSGWLPGDVYTVLCPAIVNTNRVVLHVEINTAGTGAITPLGLTNGDHVVLILDGLRWPF